MNKRHKGFTLIEVLAYVVIAALLLTTIFNILWTVFNIKKQLRVAHEVQQNVRFLTNIIGNRIHNVVTIEDIRPAPEVARFYPDSQHRWMLRIQNGQLQLLDQEYNQATGTWVDVGGGYQLLTTERAAISNWSLTPVKNSAGTAYTSALISFTLTVSSPTAPYSFYNGNFQLIVGARN